MRIFHEDSFSKKTIALHYETPQGSLDQLRRVNGAGKASIGSDSCSGSADYTGVRFEVPHGMGESRRDRFGRWFLLLYFNPHDGTGV